MAATQDVTLQDSSSVPIYQMKCIPPSGVYMYHRHSRQPYICTCWVYIQLNTSRLLTRRCIKKDSEDRILPFQAITVVPQAAVGALQAGRCVADSVYSSFHVAMPARVSMVIRALLHPCWFLVRRLSPYPPCSRISSVAYVPCVDVRVYFAVFTGLDSSKRSAMVVTGRERGAQ